MLHRGTRPLRHLASASRHQTLTLLRHPRTQTDVWLVGTAHLKKGGQNDQEPSADASSTASEVADVIRAVRPRTVVVELDAQRAAALRRMNQEDLSSYTVAKERWLDSLWSQSRREQFKQAISSGNFPGGANMPGMGAIGKLMSAGGASEDMVSDFIQKFYNALRAFGIVPGLEFKLAVEEAQACGARVVYGDRELQETMSRIWSTMKADELFRVVAGGGKPPPDLLRAFAARSDTSFEELIESLKDRDTVLAMTAFLRSVAPNIATALIDERDECLTRALLEADGPTVGVVGCAHVPGIEALWDDPKFVRQQRLSR